MADTLTENQMSEDQDVSNDTEEVNHKETNDTDETDEKIEVKKPQKSPQKQKGGKKKKTSPKSSSPKGKRKIQKDTLEAGLPEEGSPPKKKRQSKNPKERTIDPGKLRERPRLSYKDESSSEEEIFGEPVSSDSEADVRLEKKLSLSGLPAKKESGSLREKPRMSYKDESDSDIESGFESDIIVPSKKSQSKKGGKSKSGKNNKKLSKSAKKKKKAKKAKKGEDSDEDYTTKSKQVNTESPGTKRPQRNARQLKRLELESDSSEEEDIDREEVVYNAKKDSVKNEGKETKGKKQGKEMKKVAKPVQKDEKENQSTDTPASENEEKDSKKNKHTDLSAEKVKDTNDVKKDAKVDSDKSGETNSK